MCAPEQHTQRWRVLRRSGRHSRVFFLTLATRVAESVLGLCDAVRGLLHGMVCNRNFRRAKQPSLCRWTPGGTSTGWAHRTPRATLCARRFGTSRRSTPTGTGPMALTTSWSSPMTEVRCSAMSTHLVCTLPHAACPEDPEALVEL